MQPKSNSQEFSVCNLLSLCVIMYSTHTLARPARVFLACVFDLLKTGRGSETCGYLSKLLTSRRGLWGLHGLTEYSTILSGVPFRVLLRNQYCKPSPNSKTLNPKPLNPKPSKTLPAVSKNSRLSRGRDEEDCGSKDISGLRGIA